MKVALVHDYLNQYGGAERVLEVLHQLYPSAPIYTSIYDAKGMKALGFKEEGKDIRTSFMERLPWRDKLPRYYFTFLYPFVFSRLNLQQYDLVISDASYAAKYVTTRPDALHVCYCHTPPRFLYGYDIDSSTHMNWLERRLSLIWKKYLKHLDQRKAKGVDFWIANSQSIRQKIFAAYGVQSEVVYPPVQLARFANQPTENQNYFLVVSRLGAYKRVDIIVKAFNQLGWPLKVVGQGPQFNYLRQIAADNVEILGALTDDQVTNLYANCRALVLAAFEDAGISQLEAMACGKPVVALGQGGYLETIIDGRTGVFFPEQTVDSLVEALQKFNTLEFDQQVIRQQAALFGPEIFKSKIQQLITQALQQRAASSNQPASEAAS